MGEVSGGRYWVLRGQNGMSGTQGSVGRISGGWDGVGGMLGGRDSMDGMLGGQDSMPTIY